MLAVENLDTGKLEVAMLLDEPPSRNFMTGAIGGQPWRPNSPLVNALKSARLCGFCWLFIVYKGDDVLSWGSKRVKITSGGKLYTIIRSNLGNERSRFRELRYETIAPDLFAPLFGLKTQLPYKVIHNCTLTSNPECLKSKCSCV